MRSKIRYAPLTTRHRAILASAFVLIVAWGCALAVLRIRLIGWWLAECTERAVNCDRAMVVIDYWWVALLVGVLSIAGIAHWLTRDRLRPHEGGPG